MRGLAGGVGGRGWGWEGVRHAAWSSSAAHAPSASRPAPQRPAPVLTLSPPHTHTSPPTPVPPPAPRSWSAGAAAQQAALDPAGMGAAFLGQFYPAMSDNRPALAALYHPAKSQVTVDRGAPLVGRDAIMGKIMGGVPIPKSDGEVTQGMPKLKYAPATMDSGSVLDPPGAGGVASAMLVLVTGQALMEGQENPIAFGQAFLLANEGGTYVANDVRAVEPAPQKLPHRA